MKDAILLLVSVAVQNKFELLCLHKSERALAPMSTCV
jgi:hypothetical protein